MEKKYAAIALVVVVLILIVFALSTITGQATTKEIKIGMILPLTKSEYSFLSGEPLKSAQLAVDEINSKGGVNGYKLKLIIEDNQFDPSMSVRAANKLINIDKIDVGIISTIGEGGGVMPMFENTKTPLIFLLDANEDIENAGDYIFSIGFSTALAGNGMAEFAYNNLSVRKVAVIYNLDAWAMAIQQYFTKRFKELGGEVLVSESIAIDENDFRASITKVIAADVDAIYLPVDYSLYSALIQVKELGFNGTILSTDNLIGQIIELSEGSADGAYHTTFTLPTNQKLMEFKEKITKHLGGEPMYLVFDSLAYDSIKVIEQATINGGLGKDGIAKGIYKIQNMSATGGIISFNEKGIAPKVEGIAQVVNGTDVIVE